MSAEEYSCIQAVEKEVSLTLPFSYAGRTLAGIKAALESWKTQYVQCLEGILIDYKDVSFVESVGRMLLEQPFLHYRVKATFSVFKPHCGCILRGTVNRISKTHIGCVVHQFINVSIHLSPDTAGEIAKHVYLDSEILFQVSNVDAQRRVIRFKGEITPESIELMKKLLPHWAQSKHTFFDAGGSQQEYSAADANLVHLTPPSSTGSPNRAASPDDNSTSGFESLNPEVEVTPQSTVSKRPKKKRKHKEIEDESTISAFPDFGSSRIISSTPFEVPHKKLKLDNPVSATSFLDYNFAYSSSLCTKKDRKKNKESSIDITDALENQNNSLNDLTIPTTSVSSEQSSEAVGKKKGKKLKKEKNNKSKNLTKSPKTKDKKTQKKSPGSSKDKSKSKKQKKKLKESGIEKNSNSLKSSKKPKSLKDKSKIKKKDKDKKHKKSKLATSVPELSVTKTEIKEEF